MQVDLQEYSSGVLTQVRNKYEPLEPESIDSTAQQGAQAPGLICFVVSRSQFLCLY